MLKTLSITLISFLIAGCASQNTPTTTKTQEVHKPTHKININIKYKKESQKKHTHKHIKMFQTVSKENAVLLQDNTAKNSCINCGMNLTMFYKTSHSSTVDGVTKQYCSLHCLTEDLNAGKELQNPKVVDVSSLKFINVLVAYYVVGSSKRGTMSRISKYAFASLEDAKKFKAEFGGEIYDFNEALKVSKEDFKTK